MNKGQGCCEEPSPVEEQAWRDKAKRMAISQVVPDFDMVARKISSWHARKLVLQERTPFQWVAQNQNVKNKTTPNSLMCGS